MSSIMAGIADINGLLVKDGIFQEETKLELFYRSDDKAGSSGHVPQKADNVPRVRFIYGRNGAGKSTISRAVYECKKTPAGVACDLLDRDGEQLVLSEDAKQAIYVFNEDYIEHTVKIPDNGLQSIIVLGPRVDIEDRLQALNEEIDKAKKIHDARQDDLAARKDAGNKNSPQYYMKRMLNHLKGDDSWSERDGK